MPRLRSHTAKHRRDEPSTSKQDDAVPTDHSEAKTPEKADHEAKTPEPERPESPQNCSICLSNVENKAFTDSCFHTFCYICLLEWSKVKAVCPLCKQPFKKIIHNVRSLDDFDEYVIPPPAPTRDHLWENQNHNNFWAVHGEGARFRYRTTLTGDRMADYHRRRHPAGRFDRSLLAPFHRRVSREEARRRRTETALRNRRRVYDHDMWVLPVSPSRYRETSPQFFTTNEAGRYALIPWLSRELNILLHDHEDNVYFVLELVLDLIQRFEIRSEEFYELVHPFLGRHTRHFIHEFYHFARSPYDLSTYDQRASYERRPNGALASGEPGDESGSGPPRTASPDSDDDVMVVEDGSTDPPETLSQMLSRTSGVPLLNIGPINVEWNLPSALGDVRAFLQSVVGPAFSPVGSGASQMARIHSHHNYAAGSRDEEVTGAGSAPTEPIDLSVSTEPEPTVTLRDSESEDDVIFVKYEKPYAERTPIVLSSGSDDEIVDREERRKKDERKKRSRHGSGKHRRKDRRGRTRSRSRGSRSKSRDRGARSESRRSRSRDRHLWSPRGHDERRRKEKSRSRSRDRRHSNWYRRRTRSRSRSRELHRSFSADRCGFRRRRVRSQSRERRRSRSLERPSGSRRRDRRFSSSDSVEITKVKRRKAKKHKNKHRKKHKKHHKRRRTSDADERRAVQDSTDEPGVLSESKKCKKHPTGHKSSKRPKTGDVDSDAAVMASSAKPSCDESQATDAVASSGFESGDVSGDSPIDVTTVSDDVGPLCGDKDVSRVGDVSQSEMEITAPRQIDECRSANQSHTIVRDILYEIISKATTSSPSAVDKASGVEPDCEKDLPQCQTDIVLNSALIDNSNRDWMRLEGNLLDKNWPFTKLADIATTNHEKQLPSFYNEFVEKNSLVKSVSESNPNSCPITGSDQIRLNSDSDCIIDEDDDVVFECECRCRARQKCARCLKSDSSSSSSDSDSDSSDLSSEGAPFSSTARLTTLPGECQLREYRSTARRRRQRSNRSVPQSNLSSSGHIERVLSGDSDSSATIIDVVGTEHDGDEIDVENLDNEPRAAVISTDREQVTPSPLHSPIDVETLDVSDTVHPASVLDVSSSIKDSSDVDDVNVDIDVDVDVESNSPLDSVLLNENCSRTRHRDDTGSEPCRASTVDPTLSVDSDSCLSTSPKLFAELNPLDLDPAADDAVIDIVSLSPGGECRNWTDTSPQARTSSTGGAVEQASCSHSRISVNSGSPVTCIEKSPSSDTDAE